MANSYQTGSVATVHRLGSVALEKTESVLLRYSRARPVALVLPSLASELEQPALKGIPDEQIEELLNASMGEVDRIARLTGEAHEGRIHCESRSGAGATFHIELPLAP